MRGSVRSSAGLVWRHRRLLWSIFVTNLALAWMGSLSARATLHTVLDHSMESAKLVTGFDLGTLVLLMQRPEVQTRSLAAGGLGSAVLFLLIMLLMDGGVLTTYLEDRQADFAEFCASCALYLGRMVRLALYSLVPFGALMAAQGALGDYAGRLSRDAPQERLGFMVETAGIVLILLAALLVRLWFDLAQARIVHGNQRGVFRQLLRSFRPIWRSGLYAQYLGIAALAAASMAAGLWLWAELPHRAIGASFLVLELATLAQIAARLWMKAASTRWVALQPDDVAASPALALDVALAQIRTGPGLDLP